MDKFGERLRDLRKAANITQTALSEKLNVHLQTVSKWERGISEPDISQLGELAEVLGVSFEKLIGQEETDKTFVGSFSPEKLGKTVSELRSISGESQKELAAVLETSPDTVSRWERGVTCPDINGLKSLAVHFGVPASMLYCGIEQEKPKGPLRLFGGKKVSVGWLIAVSAFFMCVIGVMLGVFLGILNSESSPYTKGLIFEKTSEGYAKIIGYNGSDSDVRIPPTYDGLPVKIIGEYSFHGEKISSLTIPEGVTTIEDYAFNVCSLSQITMPDSITSIGYMAFAGSGLTTFTVPGGVTVLSGMTFLDCDSLASIVIHKGVTSIGSDVFNYCDVLSAIYYGGSKLEWDSALSSENNLPEQITVYYYSENTPADSGDYWHYVNGEPELW